MPEPDFSDFELIPDTALNLTPEAEAALFTDPDDLAVQEEEPQASFGRTVWMDWGSGVLYEDRWVSGPDAVVQVAQVALSVVRGTSPYLPDWFGRSNMEPLLGRVDSAERRILHQTDIRDTLLSCHERITDVSGFRWVSGLDNSFIDFEADVEIDGAVTVLVGGSVVT